MACYFLFVDGVGLGPAGVTNPLSQMTLPALERLAGGQRWTDALKTINEPRHVVRALDATLGVEGLPQSGTGQAALFTGCNAPQLAGRHFGPFPHSQTRDALAQHNVMTRLLRAWPEAEEPVAFANAYPPRFFEHARRRDRWTVTTRMCLDAGVRLRTLEDLAAGHALAADLTGAGLRRHLGLDVDVLDERKAGERLVRLGRRHHFVLFEYYLTDKAGHGRRNAPPPADVLRSLDRFLGAVLGALDPAQDLLVLTSDHGNLERADLKTHTRHPVPLLAYGRGARLLRHTASLLDVTPALAEGLPRL